MGCRDGKGGGVTISGGTGTWWYQNQGRMPRWGVGMVGGNHPGRYWDMVVS